MVYKDKNSADLWEELVTKNSDSSPQFKLREFSDIAAELKCDIPEYLLTASFQKYVDNDNYPIPAAEDREGYCKNYDHNYWVLGLLDFLKIQYTANKYGVAVDRYFDFGCSSGRVLRHFLCQSKTTEIWGSDINYNHIQWLNAYLPGVKAIFNHTLPSLPLEDNYFNLVSAFSVFTHIDTFEIAWLCELRRILKPGGIAYITYTGEEAWETLKIFNKLPAHNIPRTIKKTGVNLDKLLESSIPQGKTVFRHSTGPYRSLTYHSMDYIKNVWGRFFDILEIIPDFHGHQAVAVLKKLI